MIFLKNMPPLEQNTMPEEVADLLSLQYLKNQLLDSNLEELETHLLKMTISNVSSKVKI